MELFLGILLGVSLTLFGVWSTEYLRNWRRKIKLINALYLELLYNVMTAKINFRLSKNTKQAKYKFFAFHTVAFENFKQGILLNEDKHENLLLNLFQGYALIDMFNNKRIEFEKDLWSGEEKLYS